MVALQRNLLLACDACTHERISDCTALAIIGVIVFRDRVCASGRQRRERKDCKGVKTAIPINTNN